jgi:hypothetical protein
MQQVSITIVFSSLETAIQELRTKGVKKWQTIVNKIKVAERRPMGVKVKRMISRAAAKKAGSRASADLPDGLRRARSSSQRFFIKQT